MCVPHPRTLPLSDGEITTLSRLLFALPECGSRCFRQFLLTFLLRQFLLYTMAVRRRCVGTRSRPLATRSTPYSAGQGSRSAAPQAGVDSQPSPASASGSVSSIVAGQLTSVVQTSLQPLLDQISVLENLVTSAASSATLTTSSAISASATSAASSSAMPVSVADITLPSPTIASPCPNATNPVSLPQLPVPLSLK